MREVAGRLDSAEQLLDSAFRHLAKANSTSTWTCPEKNRVSSAIQGGVTELKNLKETAHNRSIALNTATESFDTIISRVGSREKELSDELGANSGVKAVKFGGGTASLPIAIALPSLAAAINVTNNINTILDELRKGIASIFGR
jgi:hypothetical protein